ncbi:MAG: CapA family protein [Clostridiales bacterium]|nr:CapA family protein [Clostridiales bacterium]
MRPNARLIPAILVFVLLALISIAFTGSGEETFAVRRIGNIHPYADNSFQVTAPESGMLEIRIHDNICVYRVLRQQVEAGETVIHWDGCGYNREKLYEKTYTVTAELTGGSGQTFTVSYDSPVEYPAQCLQYALPSSENLYLDDADSWFLEFRTVKKGTVVITVRSNADPDDVYSYSVAAAGGKISRKNFTELAGKKKIPAAGEYTLCISESSIPEEVYEYPLHITESAPEREPVTVTGEILPERGMSDSEIWELMMKPSVVIDIDSFRHQEVHASPDPESPSLGTLHGQSQGVKVIRIENEWAMIGAWNHEEAAYVEGWVPLSKLKTEEPRGEYGLLIDKQKQTLTVYRNGEAIDTLLVSTGMAEKGSLYQETSAGCFLTGYHRVNFSMNGKKYDYVIQYDGGNLLHQTPYDWGQQKKDFTLGRGYLGAKASHACIRIQPEPGQGGLNAYWLFTHIPYHTRVMILDDPWERESAAEKLKRGKNDDVDVSALRGTDSFGSGSGGTVEITFAGSFIPGGDRAFNQRKESFASFCSQQGYDSVLGSLEDIFRSDDLTCVSLGCVIQKSPDVIPEQKGTLFAPAGAEKIFDNASVELVQMTDERLALSGGGFEADTADLIRPGAEVLERNGTAAVRLKGHLFGFAGCAESDYLKEPGIIDSLIGELREAGCEKIIMLFSWSESREQQHTIVHEAMAHRSIRAGADLVVGNIRGAVRGIDFMEGVPVAYSTGDLLNGSTSARPKSQQGILVRAAFCFDEKEELSVTVIPILPYGSADSNRNEYSPASEMNPEERRKTFRNVWQDSSEAALKKIQFYMDDQL